MFTMLMNNIPVLVLVLLAETRGHNSHELAGQCDGTHICSGNVGCFCDSAVGFVISWKDHGNNVEFKIKANVSKGDRAYIAIGLSYDQRMGNDLVMECVHLDGTISVHNSENIGYQNIRLNTSFVTLESGSFLDGVLQCNFVQEKVKRWHNNLFNLNAKRFMMFARGSIVTKTGISKHSSPPAISSVQVDLQRTTNALGAVPAKDVRMMKAHASLMILGWIFFLSIGVIIARYYKPQWPDLTVGGQRVWFQLHRALMMSAGIVVVTSFIVIFSKAGGYSQLLPEASKQAHPIVGIAAISFITINLIIAACRPVPDSSRRFVFRWVHTGFAIVIHVLAIINLFLGVNILKLPVPFYLNWILVAYVVWQLFAEILLMTFKCRVENKDDSEFIESLDQDLPVNRYGISHSQGSLFKQVFLVTHIVVVTVIATSMVAAINFQ